MLHLGGESWFTFTTFKDGADFGWAVFNNKTMSILATFKDDA